jgi:hypothetical protein
MRKHKPRRRDRAPAQAFNAAVARILAEGSDKVEKLLDEGRDELNALCQPSAYAPTVDQILKETTAQLSLVWHLNRSTADKAEQIRNLLRRAVAQLDEIDPVMMAMLRKAQR